MTRLREAYEAHFLAFDVAIPVLVALAVLVGFRCAVGDEGIQQLVAGNRATVYGTIAAVAGSLLGFTITLIPITHAILSMPALRIVRESRYAPDLFIGTLHAVMALGVLCVIALVAMVVDRDASPQVALQYLAFVLVLAAAWKLAAAVRLMWLTLGVLLQSYRAVP